MPGPNLPPSHEPIAPGVFLHRWPNAATKAELPLHGVFLRELRRT